LYATPNIIRMIELRTRWAGHVAHTGEMRKACTVTVGKHERKRQVGRLRRRWEDNIRMDIRETVWEVEE